jgi:hypothetical protein
MTKATAPALDLSAVTVEDAALPAITRQRNAKDNPMLAHLRASMENNGAGKAITVPTANAKEVVYLIRSASNRLGCGARVVTTEKGKNTQIAFGATKRRARKTKAEKAAEQAAPQSA